MITRSTCTGTEPAIHDVPRSLTQDIEPSDGALIDEIAEFSTIYDSRIVPDYLQNPEYLTYITMQKGLAPSDMAPLLSSIGRSLARRRLPKLLNTAAWAYAESALVGAELPVDEKLNQLSMAKQAWEDAIKSHEQLQGTALNKFADGVDLPLRYALSLAMEPFMEYMVTGKDPQAVRIDVYKKVLDIAQISSEKEAEFRIKRQSRNADNMVGLLHELCIILTAFHTPAIGTPLPSNARSGDGVFRRREAHDIALMQPRDGEVISALAIEGKRNSYAGNADYYASIVVTKSDLMPNRKLSEKDLVTAYRAQLDGEVTHQQKKMIEQAVYRFAKKISNSVELEPEVLAKLDDIKTPFKVRTFGVLGQIASHTCLGATV